MYRRLPHPQFQEVVFHPPFSDQLYFVYLGQKQNSRESIARYRELGIADKDVLIRQLNELTHEILVAERFDRFCALIKEHEEIVGGASQSQPVQQRQFPDLKGAVKSLGAWGGDFVLVASDLNLRATHRYFDQKGLYVVKSWNDMVLA